MDSLKAALTSVKDLLDWLPDLVVALLILASRCFLRSRSIAGRASSSVGP